MRRHGFATIARLVSLAALGACAAAPASAQEAKQVPKADAASKALSDRPDDEKSIRELLAAFVEAYNARKPEAIGQLLTPQALLVDSEGAETDGREAIQAHYKSAFDEGAASQLKGALEGLRFHGGEVATLRGRFQLLDTGGASASSGRFRLTVQRSDGKWLMSELQDYAVESADSGDNHDNLRQLEWLLGDWIEETTDARLSTQVRWDDSHNFLVRTYELQLAGSPATTGTQIIGWDPRIGQIRSWNFDSRGGFGGGVWHSQGDRWLVKSTGVMRDGRSTTATQVIEKVNNDSFRFSSYDRTAGDESLDEVADVLIVRKAPEPTTGDRDKPAERR